MERDGRGGMIKISPDIENWKIELGDQDIDWSDKFATIELPKWHGQVLGYYDLKDIPIKAKFFKKNGDYFEGNIVLKKTKGNKYFFIEEGLMKEIKKIRKKRIKKVCEDGLV